MLIIDKLLISGIRWALDKVVNAVDAEMNNEDVLREELLAAQMKYELGEMDEEEFAEIEASVLQALREIQDRKRGEAGPREAFGGGGTKIESIDVSFGGDEGAEESEVQLGGGREDEEPAGAPLVGIESGSELVEEREESQLAIEAGGAGAPVRGTKKPTKGRARAPGKKKTKKRRA